MEAIKTFEYKGKKIEIHQDEDVENIREFCDHLGIMVCFHRRYNLGDKHSYKTSDYNGFDEIEAQLIKDYDPIAILPLYLYDHGGITINTTGFSHCDSHGWDWGKVGFILIPRKKMLAEWSMKRSSKKLQAKAMEILLAEIKEYDQYLQGEVYGFIIKDKDETVDSSWGYYGIDHVENSAKEMVDRMEEKVWVPA